jgi:hypothetical protein
MLYITSAGMKDPQDRMIVEVFLARLARDNCIRRLHFRKEGYAR